MRKLVMFAIGFAAASFLGSILYGAWILPAAAIVLVVAGFLAALQHRKPIFRFLTVITLGVGIGLGWFYLYDILFVLVPRVADGQTLYATVEATDYSYKTDYGCAVEGTVILNEEQYKVKAYLHTNEELAPGDTATGTFRFRLTTDGGADDPTNHRTEGIFLLAYPIGEATIEVCNERSWRHYPTIWRRQLLEQINESFSEGTESFAAALLLGERSGLTYKMDTSFRISGISHIIAVSGLHVSILFGLIYTILARRRVLSCVIGIPLLFLFAALAGFTPSITRACIMQGLMLMAMLLDREYDPPTSLAFSVLIMLAINPLTVLSVSFQLSVGCMIGILMFSEPIRNWMINLLEKDSIKGNTIKKLWRGLAASASVSVSASVITTPLVAYYFGCISLLSVVTNVLITWIITFIFYGILACLAVSLLSTWLASVLVWVVSVPIYFVLYTAEMMASLPMTAVYTSNPYVVAWLCGTYIMLTAFLVTKNKQPKLLSVCIVLTFLLSQTLAWLEPMQDDFRMTMLDVGQGQSILLQSDGKTFLVDCGGDDNEASADITAESLLSQGISRLDGIIVTHYDTDHSGGVAHLLSRIKADRLILPYTKDENSVGVDLAGRTAGLIEYVQQDLLYTFGSTKMTIFAPFNYYSDNESSICILFQRENCGILITGDRGELGEAILMRDHVLPEVDVIVAGHHGSAGSTTNKLLETVAPRIALISVGEDNRYGHPSDQVLSRLHEAGCQIFRTDIHGTIVFRG